MHGLHTPALASVDGATATDLSDIARALSRRQSNRRCTNWPCWYANVCRMNIVTNHIERQRCDHAPLRRRRKPHRSPRRCRRVRRQAVHGQRRIPRTRLVRTTTTTTHNTQHTVYGVPRIIADDARMCQRSGTIEPARCQRDLPRCCVTQQCREIASHVTHALTCNTGTPRERSRTLNVALSSPPPMRRLCHRACQHTRTHTQQRHPRRRSNHTVPSPGNSTVYIHRSTVSHNVPPTTHLLDCILAHNRPHQERAAQHVLRVLTHELVARCRKLDEHGTHRRDAGARAFL
jgi:hypothetical protein